MGGISRIISISRWLKAVSSFVLQWCFTTTERNNIVHHTKHFRYLERLPAQELFAKTGFLRTRVFRFCKSGRLQRASRIGRWALSSSVHSSIRKSSTNRVRQDLDPRPLRRGGGVGQGAGVWATSVLGAFTTTQIAHNLLFGPVRAATKRPDVRIGHALPRPEKLTKDVFGLSATCSFVLQLCPASCRWEPSLEELKTGRRDFPQLHESTKQ